MYKLAPIEKQIVEYLKHIKRFSCINEIAGHLKYVDKVNPHRWMKPILNRLMNTGYIEVGLDNRYGYVSDKISTYPIKKKNEN